LRLDYTLLSLTPKQLRALDAMLGGHEGEPVEEPAAKKDALVFRIAERLATEEGFRLVWRSLKESEQSVFITALLEMRSDGFSTGIAKSRLLQALPSYQSAVEDPAPALLRLVAVGILAHTQIWYIGDGYELPDALYAVAYRVICENLSMAVSVSPSEVQIASSGTRAFLRDLTRFVCYVTKNEVSLTKASVIYKREIPKLMSCLRRADSPASVSGGPWDGVQVAVFLVVRILEQMSVISLESGSIKLRGQQLRAFLMLSDVELVEEVFALTRNVLSIGHRHAVGILYEWLATSSRADWTPVWCLADALGGDAERASSALEQSIAVFLQMAGLCGLLEIGTHEEHGFVVRAGSVAQRTGRMELIVQPNMDVLIPEDAPAIMHYLAGQLGELQQADEMSVYRITRASMLLLTERGWKYEDLVRALTEFSHAPVAQSVLRTVRDWVSAYDKAVIWDAMLVRFQTSTLQTAFVLDPRSAGCVVETVGDLVVIVKRSSEKLTREILSDLGAPPPRNVRIPTADLIGASPGMEARKRAGGKGLSKANSVLLNQLTGRELLDFVVACLRGETIEASL